MEITDQPPEPTTVAVLGSCATRDNFNRRFNPTHRESYDCVLAQNQMSIISLMSEPVLDAWEPLDQMSDYDRWNVRTELTRSFLADLAEQRPAYVIVDFFADIHFGVIRLLDGRFVTDNRWKVRKTDWYRDLTESDGYTRLTIFKDTEEYLALWRDAFDRFVAFVAERSPGTRVIIHRGFNTNRLKLADRPQPVGLRAHRPKLSKINVPRSNELWRGLDDHALAASGGVEIDLTDTAYSTYLEHPWGPFYVHFTPDYNHRFLAELHKIVLADQLPDWLMQRISEIEEPRRERALQEAEDAHALAVQLRKRVSDVEGDLERLRSSGESGWTARARRFARRVVARRR